MKIRINIDIKVNRLVKYFIISDFFLLAGWGFIDPIFSVFIIQGVVGGTLEVMGIAAAIYWILRSVLQIPIANYLDHTKGEKDDFAALIGGLILVGISAIGMVWVTEVWELYVLHAVHAVAFAFYFASWPSIFSRHLDKDRVSFDWALDNTAIGVASGITGFLGGVIAEHWGFSIIFVAAGLLAFVAAGILLAVPDIVLPKPIDGKPILKDKTTVGAGL